MREQDRRLLPRLLQTLDTLENTAEIVNTVRKVRLIQPGTFSQVVSSSAQRDEVSLVHPNRDVELRLRGLGLMLRNVRLENNEAMNAICRAQAALSQPAGVIAREDLLHLLVVLRDLIEGVRQEGQHSFYNGQSLTEASLHAAMRAMFSHLDLVPR